MFALIKINNNTKRRVLLGAVFVLLLSVIGGGTLAYFSSVDTANNVITSGNVDIRIMEEAKDGLPFPANGISVMPGDNITKKAYVRNTGSSSVWIRVKLIKEVTNNLSFDEFMSVDINATDWCFSNGWYYYLLPVDKGADTVPLFTQINVDTAMDNRYQNCKMAIKLKAEAVQYRNNAEEVLSAKGWPEE